MLEHQLAPSCYRRYKNIANDRRRLQLSAAEDDVESAGVARITPRVDVVRPPRSNDSALGVG